MQRCLASKCTQPGCISRSFVLQSFAKLLIRTGSQKLLCSGVMRAAEETARALCHLLVFLSFSPQQPGLTQRTKKVPQSIAKGFSTVLSCLGSIVYGEKLSPMCPSSFMFYSSLKFSIHFVLAKHLGNPCYSFQTFSLHFALGDLISKWKSVYNLY